MRVIFLDVDGVLNNNRTRTRTSDGWMFVDGYLVARLARLVHETNATVVLSSTWREDWNQEDESQNGVCFNELRDVLSEHDIEIFDRTGANRANRGQEIAEWLSNHEEVESFVILDDMYDMGELIDHLIQTDGGVGLTDEDVNDAINVLRLSDETAEWIYEQHSDYTHYSRCSNCDCRIPLNWVDEDVYWNYCPNCGKKMYKEDKE